MGRLTRPPWSAGDPPANWQFPLQSPWCWEWEWGWGWVLALIIGNKGGCFPRAHRTLQRERPRHQKVFSSFRPGNGRLHLGLDCVPYDQAQWWSHPCHMLARLRQVSKGGVTEEDQPWLCCKLSLRSWAQPFLCLVLSSPNSTRKGLDQVRSKSPCN